MSPLIQIIIATTTLSLLSLSGILLLSLFHKTYSRFLVLMVSLSAGTLMGGAFLHLLPESIEKQPSINVFTIVLIAFVAFLIVEKILHWHHCHDENCEQHTLGHMNLIGDAIHNFLDGMVIAAAFSTSTSLGIATTLAVALHEIPQELSDLGVLLHSGFTRTKALLYNFIVSTFSIVGGIIGFIWIDSMQNIATTFLIPFAAGGFIYIAASDLVPEIKKEEKLRRALPSVLTFILGMGLMYFLATLES